MSMITMECFVAPGPRKVFTPHELGEIVGRIKGYYEPNIKDFSITCLNNEGRIVVAGNSAHILAEALSMRTGWRKVEGTGK